MSSRNNIQIVFAPLPEEERDVERSAAKEFAVRTAEKFRNETESTGDSRCSDVQISHLAEWKKEQLIAPSVSSSSDGDGEDGDVIPAKNTTVVFLISCGPDGSVHRSVRKTTKWIKEQANKIKSEDTVKAYQEDESSDKAPPPTTTGIVALLGHAVCKTSAEQMEEEVYSSGRRLAKTLKSIISAPQSSKSEPTTPGPTFLVETQIELESPEEKFDGWMESWVELLRK